MLVVKLNLVYSWDVTTEATLNAIQSHVVRLLRKERIKQNVSITALAARAGLSQPMVSYVERELRKPTLDTLLRISGALRLDLSDIIRRAIQMGMRSPLALDSRTTSGRRSARRQRKCSK